MRRCSYCDRLLEGDACPLRYTTMAGELHDGPLGPERIGEPKSSAPVQGDGGMRAAFDAAWMDESGRGDPIRVPASEWFNKGYLAARPVQPPSEDEIDKAAKAIYEAAGKRAAGTLPPDWDGWAVYAVAALSAAREGEG